LVRSREDYTSKGAEAFRLCAAYIAGTVYRPDLPRREKLPRSLKTFYFERQYGEGGALVLWKEGIATQITLILSNGGILTVHDPVSGNAVEIYSGTVLSIGTVPVFISWQGGGVLEIKDA
jgi:hypothetical protein